MERTDPIRWILLSNFKARQGDNCPLITNRIYFIRETKGGDILCKCPDGYYLFKTNEKKFVALKTRRQTKVIAFAPPHNRQQSSVLYPNTRI